MDLPGDVATPGHSEPMASTYYLGLHKQQAAAWWRSKTKQAAASLRRVKLAEMNANLQGRSIFTRLAFPSSTTS